MNGHKTDLGACTETAEGRAAWNNGEQKGGTIILAMEAGADLGERDGRDPIEAEVLIFPFAVHVKLA